MVVNDPKKSQIKNEVRKKKIMTHSFSEDAK